MLQQPLVRPYSHQSEAEVQGVAGSALVGIAQLDPRGAVTDKRASISVTNWLAYG